MSEPFETGFRLGGDICAGCGRRTAPPALACQECGCIRADRSGTYYLAPRLRRLAAYILDVAGLGMVGFIATALLGQWVENDEGAPTLTVTELDGLLSSIIVLLVGLALWSLTMRNGQSPGMRILNLQVRRVGGAVPAPPRFLTRDLWPFAVGVITSLIGLAVSDSADSTLSSLGLAFAAVQLLSGAWVLWQRDCRALHDMVFDTVVVQTRQPSLSQRLTSPGDTPGD